MTLATRSQLANTQASKHSTERPSHRAPARAPTLTENVLNEPGAHLCAGDRELMQRHFNHDFSHVRVHTGASAAASANMLRANAYTVGDHIVFNEGRYRPEHALGRQLLAHELAHVVQQSGRASSDPRHLRVNPGAHLEHEAVTASHAALRGEPPVRLSRGAAFAIARDQPPGPVDAAQEARDAIASAALAEPALGVTADHPVWGKLNSMWMVPLLQVLEQAAHAGQIHALDRHVDQAGGGVSVRLRLAIDAVNLKLVSGPVTQIDPKFLARLDALNDERQKNEIVTYMSGGASSVLIAPAPRPELPNFLAPPQTATAKPAGAPAGLDIAHMATTDKFGKAISIAATKLPGEVGERLRELATREAVATMVAFAAAYVVSQATPAGWFADIVAGGLLVATVVMLGSEAIEVMQQLLKFVDFASNAQTAEDLDRAGGALAIAVSKIGIDIVMAILFHKASKAAKPYLRPPPPAEVTIAEVTAKGTKPVPSDFFPANDNAAPRNVIDLNSRRPGGPSSSSNFQFDGTSPLKIEPQVTPVPESVPLPKPALAPQAGAAKAASGASIAPGAGAVGAAAAIAARSTNPRERPPFVLPLPMEKSGHLAHYRSWLGSLESDPNYTRPTTDPIAKWDQALRPAGSHGMSFATFQRGLELGLPRDRILRPDWSRSHSIAFQVDHVLELQVAPVSQRTFFDSIDNFELLDSVANGAAGPRMAAGIARERAIQAQFDPTTVNRVLKFDAVELAGGNIGEHWTVDEIQNGEHLDALSKPR